MEVDIKETHEYFNPDTYEHDIALLSLNKPIKFNDHIQPICLPKRYESFERHVCQASGWGAMDANIVRKFDIALKFG